MSTAELSVLDDVVRRVHHQLVADARRLASTDGETIRATVRADAPLLSVDEVDRVSQRVQNQLFALGPLEAVLGDHTVTEVMVNGPGAVWVERDGRLSRTELSVDLAMLRVIIERIVGPLGLRVDRTSPFVDARLPDGSRVHIAVPPLALDGPYVTIRRFRVQPHALADFCEPPIESLLVKAVRDRQSMVVSGGTGSGKTSLLNALAAHIKAHERVITIEDAAELRLPGDHTVRLEARPPNAEGVGHVPIRELVRNALRMRPDRIILGEVRGAEAFDMVQAMNTGHDGSMSTCHSNSALDTLRRLEAMLLMADVDLPITVVRDHLRAAVDLVVHVARTARGCREVRSVYDCRGEGRWLVEHGGIVAHE